MATSMRSLQFCIVFMSCLLLGIFLLIEQNPNHLVLSPSGKTLKVNVKKRDIESLSDFVNDIKNPADQLRKPEVNDTRSPAPTSTTTSTTTSPTTSGTTTISRYQDIKNLNKWNYILKVELEAKRGVIKFLTKHVINEHNFEYVRNPVNACVETKPETLLAVLSAPGNFELRERVRSGDIGDFVRTTSNRAKLVFFTGAFGCNENTTKLQTRLSDEFHNYGDIVQEDFPDVFQNLRLKAVSMLRWAFLHCSDVRHVIRMDDDIVVDVPSVVKVMVSKSQQHPNFILGSIRVDWQASRRRSIPWRPEEDYSNLTLPRFVLGQLQGYPPSTVALLYHAAIRAEPIVLEDVFITGICAKTVDVPLLSDPEFVFRHKPLKKND